MAIVSPLLRLTLQELNENPDTWGDVLNTSAIRLLEDAIAGTGTADVTLGDVTLDDTAGGPSSPGPSPEPSSRFAILNITGAPGDARNVNVPARSKVYLAVNNTTGGQVITVKTAAGSGVTIAAGEGQWVFCDGTNVLAASAATATLAATATTAANATNLGGVAAAGYAQKAQPNTYTRGNVTQRVSLASVMGDVTPDLSLSNTFYHLTTAGFNLAAPVNPVNGAQFSLIVEQGVGAPHAISFQANTFLFAGGVAPTLSTTFGNIDYLAFEYVTDLDDIGAPRWIGSIIKGLA